MKIVGLDPFCDLSMWIVSVVLFGGVQVFVLSEDGVVVAVGDVRVVYCCGCIFIVGVEEPMGLFRTTRWCWYRWCVFVVLCVCEVVVVVWQVLVFVNAASVVVWFGLFCFVQR